MSKLDEAIEKERNKSERLSNFFQSMEMEEESESKIVLEPLEYNPISSSNNKKGYAYRIGARSVNDSSGSGPSLNILGIDHVCFKLDHDIFEYGTGKTKEYRRYKKGENSTYFDLIFDWDKYKVNGTTPKSPDELDKIIKESGKWKGPEYNFVLHNCRNFVQFCLDFCEPNKSLIHRQALINLNRLHKNSKKTSNNVNQKRRGILNILYENFQKNQ